MLGVQGVNPEEQEALPLTEDQLVGPDAEEEQEFECPTHEPATFVKGKPRCIIITYAFKN